MKKTLRYIDFGEQDPSEFLSPLWEFARKGNLTTPVLAKGVLNRDTITFANLEKWDKFIYPDKIPPERELTRYYSPRGRGTMAFETGSLIYSLFVPISLLEELEISSDSVTKSLMAIVIKVLKKHGIQSGSSPWRQNSFDLCYKVGDKWKKFSSFINTKDFGKCYTTGFFIAFDVDLDLMRKLYKMETDKFKSKGFPKDIGDVVGGLHEVSPDIDVGAFDEIPQLVAEQFGWELKEDILTQEEKKKWKALAEKLKSEEWIKYGKHPEREGILDGQRSKPDFK